MQPGCESRSTASFRTQGLSAVQQKNMSKRIVAVHLLNDRSGSPLVLREALTTLVQHNKVVLYTATPSGDGFLSGIPGVSYQPIFYKWSKNKGVTLMYFMLCQFILFFRLLIALRSSDTLYINTLLPFGAALAGKLRGTRIIYHIHETSIRPVLLRRLLADVAAITAHRLIFVSAWLCRQFSFPRKKTVVIHNALSPAFIQKAEEREKSINRDIFTVSMLCSLKACKGVYHFLHLARHLPDMHFILVLNANDAEVQQFIREAHPPKNCTIHSALSDTTPIYAASDVVINLSDPGKWIEAFGMTLLEAMQWGLPVIAPTVGGVLEVVENNVNGYTIDCNNIDELCASLIDLQSDGMLYEFMSAQARATARKFSPSVFSEKIQATFT